MAVSGLALGFLSIANLFIAQGPTVLDVGGTIAGWGFGGVLAWLVITGKLKPGSDYQMVLQERNVAISSQIETLREVIPLVVKSNETMHEVVRYLQMKEEDERERE